MQGARARDICEDIRGVRAFRQTSGTKWREEAAGRNGGEICARLSKGGFRHTKLLRTRSVFLNLPLTLALTAITPHLQPIVLIPSYLRLGHRVSCLEHCLTLLRSHVSFPQLVILTPLARPLSTIRRLFLR